jgi:hypothetical protein
MNCIPWLKKILGSKVNKDFVKVDDIFTIGTDDDLDDDSDDDYL